MSLTLPNNTTNITEATLWETYGDSIYRYLYGLTHNRQLAEDLTQDTFYDAIRSLRKGTEPESLRAWLFRIATNKAMDHFRRKRLLSFVPFRAEKHGGVTTDTSGELAEQALVLAVLRQLPKETASLLMLKDVHGFTTHEIAEMFGDSYETVRKRLARARVTFRREYLRLKGEGE